MKRVAFSNIAGGKTPYKIGILGMKDPVAASEYQDIPNGTFRAYIEDADLKRSNAKIVLVDDAGYNTDKVINWQNYPEFTLPANFEIVNWGWGFPRWKDEATPSDALLRGFTHTDNGLITSPSVLPATKRSNFSTFNEQDINDAIANVVGSYPSAIEATIVQEYNCDNFSLIDSRTVNYTAYDGSLASVVIAPDSSGTIKAKFGTFSPTPGLDSLAGQEVYNLAGATNDALYNIGRSASSSFTRQVNFDTDVVDVFARILLYDEEKFNNTERLNARIIEGIIFQSNEDTRPCKVIWYGKTFQGWGIGVYGGNETGSWKNIFYPNLSPTNLANLYEPSSYLAEIDAAATDIYLDPVFYFKVPLPQQNTKYHKQNGAYVLDVDGERTIRKTQFSETIRKENVTFYLDPQTGGIDAIGAGVAYGYPNNIVPELWFAMQQFYIHASKVISLLVACRKREEGDLNIYGDLSTQKIKLCPVIRNETEAWTFGGYTSEYRPYTDFQIEWWIYLSLIICENYSGWSGYYNQTKANGQNKGSGVYITSDNPTGTNIKQFSSFEAWVKANAEIADLEATHSIFGATSKRCVFFQPADTSHEICGWGRLSENRILLHLSEPRLDFDEVMSVTLKNKINSYTKTINLKGNQNFLDVFYLPTGTYAPADVYLEYADIYGQNHKVSGDLRSHIVS